MKSLLRTFILPLLLTIALMPTTASSAAGARFTAHCLSVVDGDTINVLHDGVKEKVIFYGIDCPELGQAFGDEARRFTDDRCYKKDVTLEDHGRDSKGRTIAVVYLTDGTNLNQELVKCGLAWWSDKYAPDDVRLKQLHASAKEARLGLWTDSDPIPPWIWRNGSKSVQATIKVK